MNLVDKKKVPSLNLFLYPLPRPAPSKNTNCNNCFACLLAVISEVLDLLFLLLGKKKREFHEEELDSLFSPDDVFVLLL